MADTPRHKGIRKDRYGFRAYVKVGNIQREKRFPRTATIKTMQRWRDTTRLTLGTTKPTPAEPGSL